MAQLATLTVKLQAQIAEFQADFKEAAKSTEKFQQEFQGVATKASAYGNLIAQGVSFGVDALKNLGKSILENASNIADLSAKTGLAMSTIQRFQSVAEQTGTTVDAFADAAFKLGANLAGGNKSIVNAVTDLGLSFADLRAQSPDKQFDAITDALGRMEDPQERNRIGLILFGRTFKEIAPAVAEGYKSMADQASVSSDEQIRALDKAGDAWTRFQRQSLNNATSFAGGVILHFEEVEAALNKLHPRFGFFMTLSPGGLPAFANALGRVREEANNIDLSRVIKDMQRIALLRLNPAEGPTLLQFGSAEMKAVEADLDASLKRQNAAWDKAKAAVEAYRESVKQLRDEFSGAKLAADVKRMEESFRALTDEQRKSPEVQDRVGEAAERLRQDGARLSPELLNLAVRTEAFSGWLNKVPGQTDFWANSFRNLQTSLEKPLLQLRDVDEVLRDIARNQVPQATVGISADLLATIPGRGIDLSIPAETLVNPFREAFTNLFQELPDIILAALTSGSFIDGIAVVASELAGEFSRVFAERVAESVKTGQPLSGSSKALGVAGLGLSSFIGGFGAGQELGKGKGALAGAGAGAVAGIPLAGVTGGASIAIGAIAGAIGGWIGGMKKAKEALADLREAQAAVLQEFGGFDALKAKADSFGISIGSALTTKNADQFRRTMEELGKAIDAQKVRLEGFAIAVEGINTKAALFAAPFEALLQNKDIDGFTAKLAEMGQRGQAEFERIGTFAAAAFAGMVKESGDAIGAINALAPTLTILQKGLKEFGLTSTGTIDSLLGMFSFINDAVTGPIFASIQATGQIFDGLTKGGLVTKDIFQIVAKDIGASFGELARKGGDVSKAMALSQPILQKLWEGQQLYGEITDETTRHLLKQAEEQGLVGAKMKGVNDKILDVLIEIRDIFGDKLPKAFSATAGAAQEAARGIQREFGNLRLDPIRIQIEYEDPGFPGGQVVPRLAHGGIVRRPTLALVGEAGPEAVVPLNQLGSVSPQGTSTVIFEIAGQQIARATVPYLPGEIRRYVPS